DISTKPSDNFGVFSRTIQRSAIPLTCTGNPILVFNSGYQVTLDYQSPNGTWYSYSFLHGNNATNTWISANLNLVTSCSDYGLNPGPPVGTAPTILASAGTATPWNPSVGGVAGVTVLAQAPMFAKADPRSIRY